MDKAINVRKNFIDHQALIDKSIYEEGLTLADTLKKMCKKYTML